MFGHVRKSVRWVISVTNYQKQKQYIGLHTEGDTNARKWSENETKQIGIMYEMPLIHHHLFDISREIWWLCVRIILITISEL